LNKILLNYLVKRLAMSLVVLLVVAVILALLIQIVPGDPAVTILGPRASPELINKVRAAMHLDKPVLVQARTFVLNALHGNFGTDVFSGRSINTMIAQALPHTLALSLSGLALAVLLGVPLGMYSACRAGSWADRFIALFSVILVTIPTYVIGLLLLMIFAVTLKILPAMGVGAADNILDYLRHLLLPAAALALSWVGYLARLVRASLLEVLHENYIQAARAGGLSERLIHYRYALKNALIPTVAVLGNGMGSLMGGAVFLEIIFSRPGMGTLILQAIADRNYPVVQASVLVVTFLFVVINLLADMAYTALDKRIQLGRDWG
jgi:peptide/nickel transport system permease protein